MHPLILLPAALIGFLGGRFFSKPKHKSSPLPGVNLVSWERFVAILATSPPNAVSPTNKLGLFQMDPRKLKDAGLMTSTHKTKVNGLPGVYVGQWIDPLTQDDFLGSIPMQYAAFTKSVQAAAPKVSGYVGTNVQGAVCTLSGLLGVAHTAGIEGVSSWVKSPETRKRFKGTTKMFLDTNGVF